MIILLNVLIAIVSGTYEKVMRQKLQQTFKEKASVAADIYPLYFGDKRVNRNNSLLAVMQKETGTLGHTHETGLTDLNDIILDVMNNMDTVGKSFTAYKQKKENLKDEEEDEIEEKENRVRQIFHMK